MGYPSSFEQFVVYEPWNPAEYRERRLIAKAIHGTVHLAEHIPSGELRAIKKIPNHNVYKRPDGQLENAFVEIGASLYLSHHAVAAVSGIIRTHGAFRDDTHTYLITEFAAGGELFDEVARVGHISEEQARRIGLQLLLAVKSLHDNGVCHRDLSLENTLIHADGSIRVIDFGQAACRHFAIAEPLFDDTGSEKYLVNAAGKLYYRAPEMYSGAYRGTAADMFAAGVELFILVFGTPPWLQATPADDRFVFIQNYPDGFERLLARWKRQNFVSREFRGLIERMIQAEPSKRPSADEALAHPSLTRCDPALDFTFLSCSTWFLPPAERDAFLESEIDCRRGAQPREKSAYRSYSNGDTHAEQAKGANGALGERARSSVQQLASVEYPATDNRFHNSEGTALRDLSEGASAQRQESLVQQIVFAQSRLSLEGRPETVGDELFSSMDRTPGSESIRSAVSQIAYVKLASAPLGDSRSGKRINSPTVRDIPRTSNSYTFEAGQRLSRMSACNELQASLTPGKQCVDFGTPSTHVQQLSSSSPSSPCSSTSVSPMIANLSIRASAAPTRDAVPTSISASPSAEISIPSGRTPPKQASQICNHTRGSEKKRTSADVSAASGRFAQAEVKDNPGQDREKHGKDMRTSGIRRRTGDTRGHAKQGGSSGRKSKGTSRKSREPRVTEASLSLPTAPPDISSFAGRRKDKDVPCFSIKKGERAAPARGEAPGTVSFSEKNTGAGNPTEAAANAAFSVAYSSAADYAAARATAKKIVSAITEKATTTAAGAEKKSASQSAAGFKAGAAGSKIKASPCSNTKLSPPSGSPFSLRLRALSLVLANRLNGFKFCRCSNQEHATARRKGNAAMADGRT